MLERRDNLMADTTKMIEYADTFSQCLAVTTEAMLKKVLDPIPQFSKSTRCSMPVCL